MNDKENGNKKERKRPKTTLQVDGKKINNDHNTLNLMRTL